MKIEIFGGHKNFSAHGEYEPGVDPELKPCPFCGHSDSLSVTNTHTASYWVECDCGGEKHGNYYYGSKLTTKTRAEKEHRKSFKSAIAEWNRRA